MRSAQRPGLGRLLASAMVVLGIALMHHIVITGCSTLSPSVDHAHAPVAMEDVSTPAATPTTASTTPVEGIEALEPPGGSAAAVCLAILLGAWLAAPIVRAWRARRGSTVAELTQTSPVGGVLPRPPDLAELSVRRM